MSHLFQISEGEEEEEEVIEGSSSAMMESVTVTKGASVPIFIGLNS